MKKNNILVLIICILLAMLFKLTLELRDYEDLPQLPQVPSVFQVVVGEEEPMPMPIPEVAVQTEEEYRKEWYRDIPLEEKYQQYIYEWSIMRDLDYELLLALAYHESSFNVNALNTSNSNGTVDYGLFQVNSGNLKWVEELAGRPMDVVGDTFDNILGGILIFDHYYSYWKAKGLEGKDLLQYSINSYNTGIQGYANMGYVSRSYDRKIQATRLEIKEATHE